MKRIWRFIYSSFRRRAVPQSSFVIASPDKVGRGNPYNIEQMRDCFITPRRDSQ
ncbi:MAG TPA: hypothetical protein P5294_00920 [Smithellaceae bacterium]|nr:hypothetical protein [Smithellaceae bacterium]HRS89058.1 hypothetical protein [Smithellaceae bacterium]HRV25070.1 hypothetical protein [Smithellaceae bacterium]